MIAIIGPTASGKSRLAEDLALAFDGEIVNFDSVQIYRGFDIGSAKTPPAERRRVPHHLIDVADPAERVSAGDYARMARRALREIADRRRLPVLVGGTGLYLRAALEGLFEGPAADPRLRERLSRLIERGGAERLRRLLARLDPVVADKIHPNDAPKLIRAVEIARLTHRPPSEAWAAGRRPPPSFATLKLALDPPREALYERIERRTRAMFEQGLIEEVAELLRAGAPRAAAAFGALGYRQALAVVEGRLERERALSETVQATRNYAKRQTTWFRNQEPAARRLSGFGDDPSVRARAEAEVERFLNTGKN